MGIYSINPKKFALANLIATSHYYYYYFIANNLAKLHASISLFLSLNKTIKKNKYRFG